MTGNGTVIEITPAAPFAAGALVQVFLDTTAQDLAGNALSSFQGQFTIAPDTTATGPTLVRFSPPQTTGLPLNTVFEVEFNEALDPATVTDTTVSVRNQSTNALIPATTTLRGNGRVIRLVPTAALAATTSYKIQMTNELRDLQGTAFGGQTLFSFTTGTASDTAAPTVTAVTPPPGATNVGVNGLIKVSFSEPINPLTVFSGNVVLRLTSTSVAVATTISFSLDLRTVILTPVAPLAAGTQYTIAIVNFVTDQAGNGINSLASVNFTTKP